jgi:hypothetical protein
MILTIQCNEIPFTVFNFTKTSDQLINASVPIVYTVMELKSKEKERVQLALETNVDVSQLNLFLLTRRGKYPFPVKGEFDSNNSMAVQQMKYASGKHSIQIGYAISHNR